MIVRRNTSSAMTSSAIRVVTIILIVAFPRRCQPCSEGGFREGSEPTRVTKNLMKRSVLTFPPDSVLQINMGITLAGHLEKNNAVIVLAFQQNTPLPKEPQPLFLPSFVVSGRGFSVYDHLKDIFTSYGFDGLECLRKMICQVGETPLMGGLLEDVIAFVLSPSKHRSVRFGGTKGGDVDLLLESERLGVGGGNCTSSFPHCARTPLDMISAFNDY